MRGERPKVMRKLTCELDDRTRLEYGMKLVKELDSISKAKAAIKFHQKEAERLVSVLSEGFEVRPVECQEIPDYTAGVMNLCRLDTYETLSSREMTDEERNGNLFAGVDETKEPKAETTEAPGETISEQELAPAPEGDDQTQQHEELVLVHAGNQAGEQPAEDETKRPTQKASRRRSKPKR